MGNNVTKEPPQCTIISFCNTSYCDATVSDRPIDCSQCSVASVAVLFIVELFLCLFIVFGNIGILTVIIKNPVFHNPFNMFKCSLAAADLLVGLFVLPVGLVEPFTLLTTPYEPGAKEQMLDANATAGMSRVDILLQIDSLCSRVERENKSVHGLLFSIVSILSIMASIFTLVLLSIDRFLAVFCPIKYNQGRALNNRIAGILIFFVWAFCITLSAIFPTTIGKENFAGALTSAMIFTYELNDSNFAFFYIIFAFVLPFFLLLGLNIGTGVLLFRQWAKIKKQTANKKMRMAAMNSNNNNNSRQKSEVKASITLLVMVLVFSISTIPPMGFLVTYYKQHTVGQYQDNENVHTIYIFLILLLVANSAWNVIIYSWRNENFRQALMKLVFKTMRKGKSLSWSKIKAMTERRDQDRKRRRKMYASERETPSSGDDQNFQLFLSTSLHSTEKGVLTGTESKPYSVDRC